MKKLDEAIAFLEAKRNEYSMNDSDFGIILIQAAQFFLDRYEMQARFPYNFEEADDGK